MASERLWGVSDTREQYLMVWDSTIVDRKLISGELPSKVRLSGRNLAGSQMTFKEEVIYLPHLIWSTGQHLMVDS